MAKMRELIDEIIGDYRQGYAEQVMAGELDKDDAINECVDSAIPIYYSDMIDIIRDGNWWLFSDDVEVFDTEHSPFSLCCIRLRAELLDRIYNNYYDELDESDEGSEDDEDAEGEDKK